MEHVLVIGSWDGNDGVYTKLLAMRLAAPIRTAQEFGGVGVDVASIGPVDESANVEDTYRIGVGDADLDSLLARIDALRAELRDRSPITLGLDGSAYTGTIIPVLAQCIEIPFKPPLDAELVQDFKTIVDVIVRREAWTRGATETPYTTESLSLPAVLDLSAMIGQHAAPLDFLLDAGLSVNLHQIVCGLYPDAPVAVTKFILEAADLSWSGGAADTDANGWPDGTGNTVWKTDASAGVYTDVDVTDYLAGTYAFYANAKRDAGADPATIETEFTAPVDIEGTDLRRHFLGFVSLPCETVRGAATSSIRVTMKSDAVDFVYVNTLEIIPVGWGAVGWHHTTPASSVDKLRWADGIVYGDDVASLAYLQHGRELIALGGTLVITGEGTAEAPTLAVKADAEYDPRWEQLPSAGDLGYGPTIDS